MDSQERDVCRQNRRLVVSIGGMQHYRMVGLIHVGLKPKGVEWNTESTNSTPFGL